MTPRKWFINPGKLKYSDERMQKHSKATMLEIVNEEMHRDEIPLYVFTEEELRRFANFVWYDALDHKMTELPDQFESYWQQKFGGGE